MSKARVPVGVPGAEFIGPMHLVEVGNRQVCRGAERAAEPIQAGRASRVSRPSSGRWGKVRGFEPVPAAVEAGLRRGGCYELDWHARIRSHRSSLGQPVMTLPESPVDAQLRVTGVRLPAVHAVRLRQDGYPVGHGWARHPACGFWWAGDRCGQVPVCPGRGDGGRDRRRGTSGYPTNLKGPGFLV
jgi:hypothetical protein